MSIEFRCSKCNKLLKTKDEAAGKTVKCPGCGTNMAVPFPGNAPPPLPVASATSPGFAEPSPIIAVPKELATAAERRLPGVLLMLLLAVVATIFAGLILPRSVIATVPLLVVLGLWVAVVSFRGGQPLGIVVAISPLLLIVIFVLIASSVGNVSADDGDAIVRIMLVVYGMLVTPVLLWVRGRAVRACSQAPAAGRTIKWLAAGAIAGIALLAVLWVLSDKKRGDFENLAAKEKVERLAEMLKAADALWDKDQKPEAIAAYKNVLTLNRKESWIYELESEKPRLYRRVIEHEINYGDPAEARDWIVAGLEDRHCGNRLSLHDAKAQALLEEVKGKKSR